MKLNKTFEGAQFGHAMIKSAETDGQDLVITGVASTGLVDRSNEIVDQESLKGAINGFSTKTLFLQHNWQAAIGKVTNLAATGKELLVEAVIGKNFDVPIIVNSLFGASVVMTSVNNVREQIKQGIVNAFSIGFTADKQVEKGEDGSEKPATLICKELLEISVVTIPANKDCLFSMAKGYSSADLVDLYDLRYQLAQVGGWDDSLRSSNTYDVSRTSSDAEDEKLIGGLQECLTRIRIKS